MKFLTSIDTNHLELLNFRVQQLASDPSSPAEGWVYWNTVTHKFRVYDGTTWISFGTGTGTVTSVTAGNSTITIGGTGADPTVAVAKTLDHTWITDFDTQVRTNRLDQMAVPTASVSMNSQRITNVLDPASPQDAATKAYVDATSQGLDPKGSVVVATTTDGTLSSAFQNGATVDGVVLATGNRILIKNQSTANQNGIYTVNASGAPTRATDADASGEISKGAMVYVESGTANAGQLWICSATGATPWVPGTDSSTWTQFAGAADIVAGSGLTKSGNTLNVGAGTGIIVNADDVAVDTAVVVRKYAATIGDGSATSIAVTHNLGTKDITVSVREASTDVFVACDVTATSTTQATFTFAVAPASNSIRVVVHA